MKPIEKRIRDLLKEKRAIMLAHNYQPSEIQDLADLCGDSLELSIKASQTDAEVIVVCGVSFMAETASILSPTKTVLLPRHDAGCPMADTVTPEALKARIAELLPMPVVTYVNSTAAVKALSTICCTSANVVNVVNSLEEDEALMVPDQNLARFAQGHTTKRLHLWNGCCPIHDRLTPADIQAAKAAHPEAEVMVHPECRPEVVALADAVVSTSGMIRHAGASDAREFIVATEVGLLHPLKKSHPDKAFFPASTAMVCPDMKKITLEDVARSLERMEGEVKVPPEIQAPALKAVQRMVDLAR